MEEKKVVLIPQKVAGEDFQSLRSDFLVLEPERHNEPFSKQELDKYLPIADAIVAITEIDAEMIAKSLRLKVIVANGAGFDNIDITAANALKIPVINIPDTTAYATAELALALMLNVSRRVSEADRELHRRIDNVEEFFAIGRNPGRTLNGKNLGIIGLGHIGRQLAELCWPMKMNIFYHSRNRLPLVQEKGIRYLSLDELLKISDVVSIHCPLNDSTRNMINYDALMKMKSGAILINTARGGIVDYDAMIYFLETGKLSGVGLDVYPEEPKIPSKLLLMPQAVLTPHIGTNTIETRQQMADAISSVIREVLGNPGSPVTKDIVNPEIYASKEEVQSLLPGFNGENE